MRGRLRNTEGTVGGKGAHLEDTDEFTKHRREYPIPDEDCDGRDGETGHTHQEIGHS